VNRQEYRAKSGQLPGIEHMPAALVVPEPGSVAVSYIDYCATRIEAGEIPDLDDFLEAPLPDWVAVRWINVSRMHPYVINQFRRHFNFHTLNAEDVVHNTQRPRVKVFDDHLFVVLRTLQLLPDDSDMEPLRKTLDTEQVSVFLYDRVLITFQERPGDLWQPIRARLEIDSLRIRKSGTGYLLYSLLDAVVDNCFPVLEYYGDTLEALEELTLDNPTSELQRNIHRIKRELASLRRIVWPMREVVDNLYRDEGGRIAESTRPYLRDVYEHTIQIVEIIESYRELASGLTDLYMSAVSNRMNEIMKVLTVMASVFIPLTFIAGVYGMNFQFMPEVAWRWGYPMVWGLFILLTLGMLLFFRRKGWIGSG
jgi:magnesium transporter